MVTQLHNFKNIFITSSSDFQAISLDCQVVKRLTRALFSLLQMAQAFICFAERMSF